MWVLLLTRTAVVFLNDKYGSSWRAGWPHKELEYYSKRLAIIEWIKAESPRGGTVETSMEVIMRRLFTQGKLEQASYETLKESDVMKVESNEARM